MEAKIQETLKAVDLSLRDLHNVWFLFHSQLDAGKTPLEALQFCNCRPRMHLVLSVLGLSKLDEIVKEGGLNGQLNSK